MPTPNPPKDFDVDALVKKIDAKIAELEEEERREKEQQAKEEKKEQPRVEETSPIPSSTEDFKQKISDIVADQEKDTKVKEETIQKKIENDSYEKLKEKPEEEKEDVKVNNDIIIEDHEEHDDNFFDDFFDDDDDWN